MGAKPKQAGKKEGGWGEGIFARLLPFPFRLSKGKAEGGLGEFRFSFAKSNEASPATCPNTWKAEHRRKILFSLKEKKIGRAQNEKSKEYFSVVWRACRAVAGLASLLGVLLKKSSNINQKHRQFTKYQGLPLIFLQSSTCADSIMVECRRTEVGYTGIKEVCQVIRKGFELFCKIKI